MTVTQDLPDWSNSSPLSGLILANGDAVFSADTVIFSGYVGSWPYINSLWDATGGTDSYQVTVNYYTDPEFTDSAGFHRSVRNANCVAYRQYPVIGPYARIDVQPLAGTDPTSVGYSYFGAVDRASASSLASLDSAYLEQSGSVGAGATIHQTGLKIIPGPAIISWLVGSTAWSMSLDRFDFGTGTWVSFWYASQANDAAGSAEVAIPDAPIQLTIKNGGTGSHTFNVGVMPVMS